MTATALWDQAADHLKRGIAWWGAELRKTFAAGGVDRLFGGGGSFVLSERDGGYVLCAPNHDEPVYLSADSDGVCCGDDAVEAHMPAGARLQVTVPRHKAYRRTLNLPFAARQNVRDAVALQLGRLSPLKPERVVFDCHISHINRAEGTLTVDLTILRKETTAHAEACASALGVSKPRLVLDGDEDARPLVFQTSAPSLSQGEGGQLRLILIAALFLLSALALMSLQISREKELDYLRGELRGAIASAQGAPEIKMQLSALLTQQSILNEAWGAPSVSELMNDLTKRLPDTVHLDGFTLDGDRITIEGFAKDTSVLVSVLADSPFVSDAALREGTGKKDGWVSFSMDVSRKRDALGQ